MNVVAIDTETALIKPGLLAPPLVCLAWHNGLTSGLVDVAMATSNLRVILTADLVVGHNVSYDMAVLANHDATLLPDIFEAYEDNRVADTMLAEQLIDIATGSLGRKGYSLDALSQKHLDLALDKSTWRLKYGTLIGTPIHKWPQGAIDYALGDVDATRRVFMKQLDIDLNSWNIAAQSRAAFSLQLMCVWGMRCDPIKVAAFKKTLLLAQAELFRACLEAGLIVQGKKKATRCLAAVRAVVAKAYAGNPPLTAGGSVATDQVTIDGTDDPILKKYSAYVSNEKLLNTYLPVLEEGTRHPINASFRLVETGRRGATKNMQTPPRTPGVRECFVPREGFVFCACDLDSAEFRALGQVNVDLFGDSPIADLYQDDPNADPHTKLAAEIFLGISYAEGLARKKAEDPELLRYRQAAKAYNFGLPGGLGVAKFVAYAKDQYGYETTEDEARTVKANWIKFWRLQRYFDYIAQQVELYGQVTQLRSNRIRGGIGFCDGANTLFQGLIADGMCETHFRVSKACYIGTTSPLFGSRIVNFLHDELLLEVPEWCASGAAPELSRLMNETMELYLPNVPVRSSPTLMRFWSKKAKAIYKEGVLQVWG